MYIIYLGSAANDILHKDILFHWKKGIQPPYAATNTMSKQTL